MKIKLGYGNIYDDIEQMEQIASLYGPEIKFRIDVNGQLDLVKAIRFCKSMEEFNIDYIEQPLPYDSLEDLSELRLHTNIPIAVDESLFDIESAKKIIDIQAADIFIIKPMIIGDYTAVNRIINLANKNFKVSLYLLIFPTFRIAEAKKMGMTEIANLDASLKATDASAHPFFSKIIMF